MYVEWLWLSPVQWFHWTPYSMDAYISFFPFIVGKEDLFPFFLCHAQSIHPLVGPAKKLLDTSNLRSPASWYATSTSAMQCSLKGDSYDGQESMMLHTFSGFLKPVLSQGGSCIMQDPQTLEKLTKPCITSTRQGRPYIVLHWDSWLTKSSIRAIQRSTITTTTTTDDVTDVHYSFRGLSVICWLERNHSFPVGIH